MNVLYSRKILGSALVGCVMVLAIAQGAAQWINRDTQDSLSSQASADQIVEGTTGSFPTPPTAGRRAQLVPPGAPTSDKDGQTPAIGSSGPAPTASCDPALADAGQIPSQLLPNSAPSAGFGSEDWRTLGPRCSDGGNAPSMIAGHGTMFSSGGIPPVGVIRSSTSASAQLSASASDGTSTPTPAPPVIDPAPPTPPVPPPTAPPSSMPPSSTPPSSTPPSSTPRSSTPPSSTPPSSTPPSITPPSSTPPSTSTPANPAPVAAAPLIVSDPGVPSAPSGGPSASTPDPFGPTAGPPAADAAVGDTGIAGNNLAPTDVSPTPEPGSMLLIGTGLVGILGALRKRRLL